MIKVVAVSDSREARYRQQVDRYLGETRRLLQQLAAERRQAARRRPRPRIVDEVKAILRS